MDLAQKERILLQLRRDACRIAEHFNLEFRDIQAESSRVKRRYGVCYEDGLIKIRLFHVRTLEALKYSGLVATLCHELAHLRHFDHGPEFKKYYWRLLNWARRQQIYQPASSGGRGRLRPGASAPQQPGRAGTMRRNGVPVFRPRDDRPYHPPWEKVANTHPRRPAISTEEPPAARPAPTVEPERGVPAADSKAPKQLTLF